MLASMPPAFFLAFGVVGAPLLLILFTFNAPWVPPFLIPGTDIVVVDTAVVVVVVSCVRTDIWNETISIGGQATTGELKNTIGTTAAG